MIATFKDSTDHQREHFTVHIYSFKISNWYIHITILNRNTNLNDLKVCPQSVLSFTKHVKTTSVSTYLKIVSQRGNFISFKTRQNIIYMTKQSQKVMER